MYFPLALLPVAICYFESSLDIDSILMILELICTVSYYFRHNRSFILNKVRPALSPANS
jgi:hypothetical protein